MKVVVAGFGAEMVAIIYLHFRQSFMKGLEEGTTVWKASEVTIFVKI